MRPLRIAALLLVALAGALLTKRALAEPDRTYWGNGQLRAHGTGEPGEEHGEWTYWYASGQLRERGRYEAGRRVGTWTQWYANGQRAASGERRPQTAEDGAGPGGSPREAEWTFWHENGDLRARGRYEAGRRVGPWRFWRLDPEGGAARLDEERSGVYADDRRVGDLPEPETGQR